MGNFKDFDLDLKQIKTNNEVGTQELTDLLECATKLTYELSKRTCSNPSTHCSPSDMTMCRNGDAGIGLRC